MDSIKDRNYNTISPSAKMVLLLKGHTDIPYAKETAVLISKPESYDADLGNKDIVYQVRTLHFEERYKSIDQLLEDVDTPNIMELSSGFSLRSLDVVSKKDVHYIDTDLPGIIEAKKELVAAMKESDGVTIMGKLEITSLNALDKKEFETVTNNLSGAVTIVNEGLLMYLDTKEKEQLCSNIKSMLQKHGGYWITADIYTKLPPEMQKAMEEKMNDNMQAFFEQHNIEANKFDSYDAAEVFFDRMGFVIDKEAKVDHGELTSIKYVMNNPEVKRAFENKEGTKAMNMRATWRLKLK